MNEIKYKIIEPILKAAKTPSLILFFLIILLCGLNPATVSSKDFKVPFTQFDSAPRIEIKFL